jgi:hypothetical protein
MIGPAGALRLYFATRPVDFRKGMDGLAALAQARLRLDPFSGALLVSREGGPGFRLSAFEPDGHYDGAHSSTVRHPTRNADPVMAKHAGPLVRSTPMAKTGRMPVILWKMP